MILHRLPTVLAFAFLTAAPAVTLAQAPRAQAGSHVARVEQWLRAIYEHEPGTADRAATLVASWPNGELHTLLTDARVLTQLLRNPRRTQFTEQRDGERYATVIRYTSAQLERLRILARVLACVAPRNDLRCVELVEVAKRDEALKRLLSAAQAGPQTERQRRVAARSAAPLGHRDAGAGAERLCNRCLGRRPGADSVQRRPADRRHRRGGSLEHRAHVAGRGEA